MLPVSPQTLLDAINQQRCAIARSRPDEAANKHEKQLTGSLPTMHDLR
jgi:hypothetical protein